MLIALGDDVDGRCSVGLMYVSDPLENDVGCPQLRVRPAGIASGAERLGQPHAGDRRLVRCADFVPETRRSSKCRSASSVAPSASRTRP